MSARASVCVHAVGENTGKVAPEVIDLVDDDLNVSNKNAPSSEIPVPTSHNSGPDVDEKTDRSSRNKGSDDVILEFKNSRNGVTCSLTETELMNYNTSEAMQNFNSRCASENGKQLHKLVQVVNPTDERACAAAVVVKLLDHDTFTRTDQDGVHWVRKGHKRRNVVGNRLQIDRVNAHGYSNYLFVEGKRADAEAAKQQLNSTMSVSPRMWTRMNEKRDEWKAQGLGIGCDNFSLETFADQRLGAAFIMAYVFLVEEMKKEVMRVHGSCGDLIDSHTPNSNNPYANFIWHTDNHAELNNPGEGPFIEHTVTCQCSPGRASMAVAGAGDLLYKGVGSFIVFPAWSLHRTKRVEAICDCSSSPCSCSLWKMAGFFAPVAGPLPRPLSVAPVAGPLSPAVVNLGNDHTAGKHGDDGPAAADSLAIESTGPTSHGRGPASLGIESTVPSSHDNGVINLVDGNPSQPSPDSDSNAGSEITADNVLTIGDITMTTDDDGQPLVVGGVVMRTTQYSVNSNHEGWWYPASVVDFRGLESAELEYEVLYTQGNDKEWVGRKQISPLITPNMKQWPEKNLQLLRCPACPTEKGPPPVDLNDLWYLQLPTDADAHLAARLFCCSKCYPTVRQCSECPKAYHLRTRCGWRKLPPHLIVLKRPEDWRQYAQSTRNLMQIRGAFTAGDRPDVHKRKLPTTYKKRTRKMKSSKRRAGLRPPAAAAKKKARTNGGCDHLIIFLNAKPSEFVVRADEIPEAHCPGCNKHVQICPKCYQPFIKATTVKEHVRTCRGSVVQNKKAQSGTQRDNMGRYKPGMIKVPRDPPLRGAPVHPDGLVKRENTLTPTLLPATFRNCFVRGTEPTPDVRVSVDKFQERLEALPGIGAAEFTTYTCDRPDQHLTNKWIVDNTKRHTAVTAATALQQLHQCILQKNKPFYMTVYLTNMTEEHFSAYLALAPPPKVITGFLRRRVYLFVSWAPRGAMVILRPHTDSGSGPLVYAFGTDGGRTTAALKGPARAETTTDAGLDHAFDIFLGDREATVDTDVNYVILSRSGDYVYIPAKYWHTVGSEGARVCVTYFDNSVDVTN